MANIFSEKPIVKVVMLKGQDGEDKLINQADGSGLSFWVGTQEEYDAIPEAELINNCVYYITDDTRDDFRTDLNALDTKVDNNTTAIADNATSIESINTTIAPFITRYYKTCAKGGENDDLIVNKSKFNAIQFLVNKIGATVSVAGSFTLATDMEGGGEAVNFVRVPYCLFGSEPTLDQLNATTPLINSHMPAVCSNVNAGADICMNANGSIGIKFKNNALAGTAVSFSIMYHTYQA